MQLLKNQNVNITSAAKILLLLMVSIELFVSLVPFDGIETMGTLDKLLHFSTHAANAVVAALAFPAARSYIVALALLFLFGPLIELLQHFSPGRVGSISDQLANTLGLLAGAVLPRLLQLRKKMA